MVAGRRLRSTRAVRLAVALFAAGASVTAVATSPSALATGFQVTPVSASGGPTPSDLAEALAGPGVSVSNATLKGATVSAGTFVGGTNSVGIDSGVALSSGSLAPSDPEGCQNILLPPNTDTGTSCVTEDPFAPSSDTDLEALISSPDSTHDASVLEFDFVPTTDKLAFTYVFGSEEYNEYVNSDFNDVFGFFVNGTNCALVPGTESPVAVNTVNNGNPLGTNSTNPDYYRNNDFQDGTEPYQTQLDGMTVPLVCQATVNPDQTNHVKLAIADVTDTVLDSAVMLQAGSFISGTTTTLDLLTDETVQYSDPLAVSATLQGSGPVEGATVTFTMGSSTTTAVTDAQGVATAALPALDQPGLQTVSASFAGSAGLLPSADSTTVQELQEGCVLTYTGDASGTAGQPVTLSAQFAEPAADTSPGDLSGRSVTFELTNEADSNQTALKSATTDGQGVATTTVTLTEGAWLLEPSFDGDFYYSPCNDVPPDLTIDPPTQTYLDLAQPGAAQYSDPLSVSATLSVDGGLADQQVDFTLGSANTSGITDQNGVATASIPVTVAPGEASLGASFAATGSYAGSTDSTSITVSPEDCTLTYNGATVGAAGSSITFAAAMGEPDSTLGDRSGKTVTFTADDGENEPLTFTGVTNGSGNAQTTGALTQGTWTVTPSFDGDGFYSPCADDPVTVTVGPRAPVARGTTLDLVAPNGVQYSDLLDVTATLASGGGGVAGQVVTFSLGSATASAVTNQLGVASASLPADLQPGTATVHAAFAAVGGYLGSSDSAPVTVAREDCTLDYTGAHTGVEKSRSVLAATFGESDATSGDHVGRSVTFALSSGDVVKSVTRATDAAGVATASKLLAPGSWQVRPSFAGDAFYNACNGAAATLVVEPLLVPTDTEILSVPDSVQYSDHVSVSVSLTTVGGSALAPSLRSHRVAPAARSAAGPSADGVGGASVDVSLGKASTTVVTDATGHAEASLKVKDPAGTKTLHVDYGGNSHYGSSHTSIPVHLKLEDTSLNYDGDTSADSGTAATVAAVLSEEDGSVGDLAGHVISFALHNGVDSSSVSATTNGSGRASASVTLPAGTWSVTPTFEGDQWYRPSSAGSASIVVTDASGTTPASGPSSGPAAEPAGGPGGGHGNDTQVLGEKETRPTEGGSTEEPAAGEPSGGEHGSAAGGEHGAEAEHPLNTKQPTFVLSLPDVHQVSLASSTVLINGLLALLMLLMIAFPAELFNGTLKENYDEVRGWFGPITRFLHRIEASAIHGHPVVRTFGSLLFVGLTGVIYSFVEPGFGFDRKSLQLILALTFGLVVITVLANESALLFGRLRYHEKGRLRARPGALLVALACVLLSRAANFEPGYVYGLVAGFTFSRELPRRQDGKVVLAWAGWLLALAAGGWLLLSPVKAWALHHETSFWAPVVEELTAAVVVESLTILILALVPLTFLEGERIWKWRRSVWVVVYGVALFAFLHVVVHPEFGGRKTELPLFTWLGFFLGFMLFSVAFWAYFRFRHHEPAEA